MKILIKNLLIALWLLPMVSLAGQIDQILFDNSVITIHHNDCQLKQPIQDKHSKKLILPVTNCASKKGVINVVHPNLKKIHWAQHDPLTVWIVATFSQEYQYKISFSPNQYRVNFSASYQQNYLKEHTILEKQAHNINIKRPNNIMFSLNDILFQIPLQDMLIDEFFERSIGFKPADIIKDGLPHFGAKRDDWKGKTRRHRGYDIYVNKTNVVASAHGVISTVSKTNLSGLYVKLHHGSKLYTVYIHLKSAAVKKGQKVRRGDVIGKIDGPVGNAIAPQLHFEIKPNNTSADILPLIEQFYQGNQRIIKTIAEYKLSLQKSIQSRNLLVKKIMMNRK